jgi:hypothetical protein
VQDGKRKTKCRKKTSSEMCTFYIAVKYCIDNNVL